MLQALSFLSLVAIYLTAIVSFSRLSAGNPSENVAASNGTLLWGPYRSNLYFGVRPRIPKSLLTGLMWAKVDNFATAQNSESTPCLSVRNMFLHAKDFVFRVADRFRLQTYLRTT